MKIVYLVCLALVLTLCGLTAAERDACPRGCTREYDPVCAVLKRKGRSIKCTFANPCMLRAKRCQEPNENWREHHRGKCSGGQHVECVRMVRG